ncbi:transglutaminase family protein [Psychromonas sp. MME1]|uniref:transglutaminase-like domain-containing protein n=1 Tax=Psychromonas sp. MME1 TaxID=3231032 RepID=UPI0034E27892
MKPLKPQEQIVKALQFVQGEIRYLGIELGVNSHQPHDPDEVFKNRFGDCKDKTLLLIAILEKLGITAHPALVSTFGAVNLPNELPSPIEFNHVITRVESDDQVYWLDPTRSLQSGALDRLGYRSYDNALVVGHPYLALVEMPKTAQQVAEIRTREYFNVIAYEAPVDYRIVTEYSGIEAEYIHSQFITQGQTTMARKFLNYMNRIYPNLQAGAPLTFEYDSEQNIATVVESYRLTDFFRTEPERLLADIYPYSIAEYFTLPTTVNRKTPLGHIYPIKVMHQSYISYPEWIKMSLFNNTESIDTPYFSLSFSEDYRDRAIITSYLYESKGAFIPVKDVPEHIAKLRKAKNSLAKVYEITYTKNQTEQTMGTFIEHLNKHIDRITGDRL